MYPGLVSVVSMCWLARDDNDLNRSHGPHRALDGSEDNVVSSHIPELDSQASRDSSDVYGLCSLLLPRKRIVDAL